MARRFGPPLAMENAYRVTEAGTLWSRVGVTVMRPVFHGSLHANKPFGENEMNSPENIVQ